MQSTGDKTRQAVRAALLVYRGVEPVPPFLALWPSCLHSYTVHSDRLAILPIKVINRVVCREIMGVSGTEMRGHFRQSG